MSRNVQEPNSAVIATKIQTSASNSEHGQINTRAAEVYEEFFLPALFQEWPPRVAEAARIGAGQRVLDVACGTGVLARAVAPRVVPNGSVTGLDINPGMLAVARRVAPTIDWREGRAEALPFENDRFDAVVSQFGLMFFEDRGAAIKEMMRVLKPGGRLAVAVWDVLESSPGYAAMVKLLQEQFGAKVADALRAPFALGDTKMLRALFDDAGVANAEIATHNGTARFASLESWIYTDIKGWTLADAIDDSQYRKLIEAARGALGTFVGTDGQVCFHIPAHIVVTVKERRRGS